MLATLISPVEYASLVEILPEPCWTIHWAPYFTDIEAPLRSASIGLVVCGGRREHACCWKDVWNQVQRVPFVPQFIVADPVADEDLWVEVLHFGCYDLLRTPFDPEQALRVVSRAWDFWKREQTRLAALSKLAQPSEQSFPQCRRTAVCP